MDPYRFYEERSKRLQESLSENRLDAFLTFDPVNIRYLTGFSGSSAVLFLTRTERLFLTDFRYKTQAEATILHYDIQIYQEQMGFIADLVGKFDSVNRVGVESEKMTVASFEDLEKKVRPRTLVPTRSLVESLRIIKDDLEIQNLRQAIRFLEVVLPEIKKKVEPGLREIDLAIEAEYLLRKAGADGNAFDFIVASGVRSSMPHGVASQKKIEDGDLLTLDWGARYSGYNSDNTRTFGVGDLKDWQKEIFSLVLEANQKAIRAVRPGVSTREVDNVARDHIREAGYGEYFGHGTGHGIGLNVHEIPFVTFRSGTERPIQNGMVFTIEPGIYLPEKGGVRIEDMVWVTETGCETLSSSIPKELEIL